MSPITSALAALRTGKGLKGQLMRGGVGSIGVKLGSTGLNVLLAVVLARALGVEEFGVYSFCFALITTIAIPAQMGLPNLVLRETAKAQGAGDWALMRGLWGWSTRTALIMSCVLIVLGAGAAWVFADRLSTSGLTAFYWGLALVPLMALGNLRGAALRGLRHVVQGQLPEFVLRPTFLIVLVLVIHFGMSAHTLQASDAMMLHAVASMMAFAIGAIMLLRARPQELNGQPKTRGNERIWLRSAIPLGVIGGMQLINQNVGLIALGMLAETEDVGLFRIVLQATSLIPLGLIAVNAVADPFFARFSAEGNVKQLQRLTTLTAQAGFILALPVSLLYLFYGSQILGTVFGASFATAYPSLAILTIGQLINALAGSVGSLLTMAGQERVVLFGMVISALANCILVFFLTPPFGIEGAAIAGSVGLLLWNAILLVSAKRNLGINSTAFPI